MSKPTKEHMELAARVLESIARGAPCIAPTAGPGCTKGNYFQRCVSGRGTVASIRLAPFRPTRHKCEACGRAMTDRTRKFCGIPCRNRGLSIRNSLKWAAKRKANGLLTCAREGCTNQFALRWRTEGRRYCSRRCHALVRGRTPTPRTRTIRDDTADQGNAVCPEHHRPLKFSSHPLSGATYQWCPVCGWQVLRNHRPGRVA